MTEPSTVYRVIGHRRVLNTDPGDTFTQRLSPDRERSLIEAGHIELATSEKSNTTSKEK